MLERLDEIPWSRLRCQGGYAGHVPQAVRDLLSEDLEVAKLAYWRLENHVVLQGELYEAAQYLPGFLFEALDRASYKFPILELLFQIGNGYSPDPDLCTRCHEEVITGLKQWLASSVDAAPSVRAAAEEDLRDLRE